MTRTALAPPARTATRPGLALAALAGAQLTIALDFSIVYVALPGIGADLAVGPSGLTWIVNAYVVATGGLLLLGGRATDLLGARRMFLLGAALYGTSSAVGGLAGDAGVLIAVRAVQGIGGALLFPAALALLNATFSGAARARAHGVWGAAGAAGLCCGSLLGGLLVHAFAWPAVFWVNLPMAGLLVAAALLAFPSDRPTVERRGLDARAAVSGTAAAALATLAVTHGADHGWWNAGTAGLAAAAALCGTAFSLAERHSHRPLIPRGLLAGSRGLLPVAAVTALYGACFGAVPFFLTLHFQQVQELGPLATGLAFLLPALVTATATQATARLSGRWGVRPLLLIGAIAGAAGALALAATASEGVGYAPLVPGLVLLSVGQGAVWTAMWLAAARRADLDQQGAASGVASTALQLGTALGLAALTAAAGLSGTGGTASLSSGITTALLAAGCSLAVLATICALRVRSASPELQEQQ
ncbi:MFS transporter [Streptomyces spiramenti]|uniref:MFS transporter n=1 Tax=Streptomyces spiramenti TaxID=2720606 RepID=A0ABX1AEY5_9ACTN|nr:MFS transporter [Streptomyces spiramenti]NJP64750.1 MFS transporter [Streptomyces spiramenti]